MSYPDIYPGDSCYIDISDYVSDPMDEDINNASEERLHDLFYFYPSKMNR